MKVLLLFIFLGTCQGAPFTPSCTSEEIMQPITKFMNLVEDLQSPSIDYETKLEEIEKLLYGLEDHYELMKNTCGEENSELLDKLRKFNINTKKYLKIMDYINIDDLDGVKDMLESVADCKHVLQFLITKVYFQTEQLDNLIDLTLSMDDPKIINYILLSIIYNIRSRNIDEGILLVPVLKHHILSNENNIDHDIVNEAKLNLKLLSEISISYYPDALIALSEVDSHLADQTIKDIVTHEFTNTIFSTSFDVIKNMPVVHLKCVALKALYDKVVSMKLENSLVATKIVALAELIKTNNTNDSETLKLISENTTNFNKQLLKGYSCRSIDNIELSSKDKNYFTFQDPKVHIDIENIYKVKNNGELLKIDVEIKHHANDIRQSFVLLNGEYPEDINLSGNIISKNQIGSDDKSVTQYCELKPEIEFNVCIYMPQYLNINHDEAVSLREENYKMVKDYNKRRDAEWCPSASI
uniref:Putative secreted protein n=1 Tax=Xenopsylla cheopis TaxID=163159 RepID=A0A6M2E0N5_XENCH